MKSYPRIRKTIKWGGAAATVLLVVVWVGSGWQIIGWSQGSTMVQTAFGCLDVSLLSKPIPPKFTGWHTLRASKPRFELWHSIEKDPVWGNWRGMFPLWWAIVPVLTATAIAWRIDAVTRRRAKQNLCSTCGYHLAGLATNTVCPECGAAPAVGHSIPKPATDVPDMTR